MDCKQEIDVLIIGVGAAGLTAWRELHSAGEATDSRGAFGTVHAALNSGISAA